MVNDHKSSPSFDDKKFPADNEKLVENQLSEAQTATSESRNQTDVSRNLLHRLRQDLPLLSPAERVIGEYVLERPRQVLRLPMDQLAKEIGVSQGTLSNFCQSLGFSGFKDFKLELAAEATSPLQLERSSIVRGDTLNEIANKAISANIDALLTTLKSLDMQDIERAIEAIQQARKIDIYGFGTSSVVALDAFNRFFGIGLLANWLPDMAHQLASSALLTSQDVALAFSYAGETRVTVKALSQAHQNGATTIVVTGNPRSSLARHADIKLVVTPREPTNFHRNLRISARIAMLGIVDIIYLGLLYTMEESSVEKVYQLFTKVDELRN